MHVAFLIVCVVVAIVGATGTALHIYTAMIDRNVPFDHLGFLGCVVAMILGALFAINEWNTVL